MLKVHEVLPYLRVRNTPAAIDFYKKVFDAQELFRLVEPDGRIGHAEIKIGEAVLLLPEESSEWGTKGPQTLGGTTFAIHLHVDDVDALFRRAVEAGATPVREPADQFYGERSGTVRDPFGHEWHLGHEIEKVTHGEMQRRYTALFDAKPSEEK